MSDPTDLLRQMAERSERKLTLPKNLTKGSWVGMTDEEVFDCIIGELFELADELGIMLDGNTFSLAGRKVDWNKVADEAGDIYHFASMGADPARTVAPVPLGKDKKERE